MQNATYGLRRGLSMRYWVACAVALVSVMCRASAALSPFAISNLTHESFDQFDQSNGGWRTLQVQRDYHGADEAIRKYMELHASRLTAWQRASLSFHLAHIYALEGDSSRAIRWFRKSNSYHVIGNPAYPNSFIAFLKNDRAALLHARKTIATTNPGPWRAADLKEVDALVEYFGDPFEAAWGALMCHGALSNVSKNSRAWYSYCSAVDVKYRDLYLAHGIKLREIK